jgi:hypothetical protein
MRVAIIIDGTVVNIVEVGADWASDLAPEHPSFWGCEAGVLVASDEANVGWAYVGGSFVVPDPSPPPLPTPIEQIRAIEAPNDDNRKKITRQFMLAFMFKEAKDMALENPETANWTDAQVQSYLMAQGKGYAKLYAEEQAIIPLRELIP